MYITLQRYFGFLALIFVATLQADECGFSDEGRHTTSCVDDFQIRATVLVFKPTMDQNSYVISSTDNRFGGEVYPKGG